MKKVILFVWSVSESGYERKCYFNPSELGGTLVHLEELTKLLRGFLRRNLIERRHFRIK